MSTTNCKRGSQNRQPHRNHLLTALFVAVMVMLLTLPAFAAETAVSESTPDWLENRDSGGPGKALYLLPDRQSFERLDGSQRDQDAFFDWINTKALPELRRLARENRFYEWSDLATIQSEDGAFLCQATPKGSYGEYAFSVSLWHSSMKSWPV